jgi:hypothetical protein
VTYHRRLHQIPAHKRERGSVSELHACELANCRATDKWLSCAFRVEWYDCAERLHIVPASAGCRGQWSAPQGKVRLKYTVAEEGQEAFRTHYNYIRSLRNLTSGSILSYTNIGQIRPGKTPHLDSKKNLIELTKRSLSDEADIVQVDKDYSYACASWLPVKAYYLLFNLMLTIEYLFTLDPQSFKLGHGRCSQSFTDKLAAGDIVFSAPRLNRIYDKTIFTHHEEDCRVQEKGLEAQ